jgi:uncharacterized protein (DUF1330 family)
MILLSRAKVYELALSSIKGEHVNDFMGQYIPKVFPIMAEYGGKFLISGTIQNSMAGKFPARSLALLEWPSIEQFVNINKDRRITPLLEMRNGYLDFIKEGCFYRVLEDTGFEIPDDRRMTILLSNRTILGDRSMRLLWIDDVRNSGLSLNLYFSGNPVKEHDKDTDIEEFSVLVA